MGHQRHFSLAQEVPDLLCLDRPCRLELLLQTLEWGAHSWSPASTSHFSMLASSFSLKVRAMVRHSQVPSSEVMVRSQV
jgi:hypothetical protein